MFCTKLFLKENMSEDQIDKLAPNASFNAKDFEDTIFASHTSLSAKIAEDLIDNVTDSGAFRKDVAETFAIAAQSQKFDDEANILLRAF